MCKYSRFPLRKRQEHNDSGVLRAVSFSYPYCSSVCMYCAGREEGGRPGSWAILCYSFASRGAGSAKYAVTISRGSHLPTLRSLRSHFVHPVCYSQLLPLSSLSAAVPGHLLLTPPTHTADDPRFLRVTSSAVCRMRCRSDGSKICVGLACILRIESASVHKLIR